MLNNVLGNGLIRPGGAATLASVMAGTQAGSLIGLYMMGDDSATAENSPGLTDSSGNNNVATSLTAGNPSWDSFFTFQAAGPGNIETIIDGAEATPRYGWQGLTTIDPASGAFTLLCFVNQTVNAGCAISFVNTDAGVANRGAVLVQLFDNNTLLIRSFDDSGTMTTLASLTVTDLNDNWHMIGVTSNGVDTITVNVDGVDVTPVTTNMPAGTFSTDRFVLGANSSDGSANANSIGGNLGPCGVWSAALTEEEFEAIYVASGL